MMAQGTSAMVRCRQSQALGIISVNLDEVTECSSPNGPKLAAYQGKLLKPTILEV